MNSVPDKALIEEVALEKGISPAFVEKDWYVTQIIGLVSAFEFEDFKMIFTGGTSLSKAHGLLERFSEDIDFRVISSSLAGLSSNQQRKRLSDLKNKIFSHIAGDFTITEDNLTARNGNRFFAIELDYPTVFDRSVSLRPHVLIEFTITALALPAIALPISSFIATLTKSEPEVKAIDCIDPVENAADKLSALVWRIPDRVREEANDDPAIVRHIHDLSILGDYALAHKEFRRLAIEMINQDDQRSKKIAGLSIEEKFGQMMEIIEREKEYFDEYDTFVKGMSYAAGDKVPSFAEALAKVKLLIGHVLDE